MRSSRFALTFLLAFLFISWMPLKAQPCERADIQDKKQLKIMKRFIRECQSKGFLKEDYGYIHLAEWVDKEGETNWQVWVQKKWQPYPWIAPFLGHCTDCIAPVGWTTVSNRLVIRYNSDRVSDTLTKAESSCLEQLLTPYVKLLPPLALPPKEVPRRDAYGRIILDHSGKPLMQPFYPSLTAGGGGGHNTHITFKKDGSIEKGLSL